MAMNFIILIVSPTFVDIKDPMLLPMAKVDDVVVIPS